MKLNRKIKRKKNFKFIIKMENRQDDGGGGGRNKQKKIYFGYFGKIK